MLYLLRHQHKKLFILIRLCIMLYSILPIKTDFNSKTTLQSQHTIIYFRQGHLFLRIQSNQASSHSLEQQQNHPIKTYENPLIILSSMSSVEAEKKTVVTQPLVTTQTIFKYVNLVVVSVLLFCLKGFLKFRDYCIEKGYYVFSVDSLVWCGVGFVGIYVLKYSYYHFMRNKIAGILHPKYQGEERVYKLNSVLKLSLDSVFYSLTTVFAYFLFKDQYWFPTAVGGCGQCSKIYSQYPNWPKSASNLEMYFMIQLGVHIFSVFEMIVIKRKTQRKFYQYLLHHSVAASLILFSMMCNQITAGTMILIIHDASDIFLAFGRALAETKYSTNSFLTIIYLVMCSVWIYLRIIIFPFCLLANVYANKPTPQDECYLLWMAFVLYGMHLFWTYFIIKAGMRSLAKKELKNIHDTPEKQ